MRTNQLLAHLCEPNIYFGDTESVIISAHVWLRNRCLEAITFLILLCSFMTANTAIKFPKKFRMQGVTIDHMWLHNKEQGNQWSMRQLHPLMEPMCNGLETWGITELTRISIHTWSIYLAYQFWCMKILSASKMLQECLPKYMLERGLRKKQTKDQEFMLWIDVKWYWGSCKIQDLLEKELFPFSGIILKLKC